ANGNGPGESSAGFNTILTREARAEFKTEQTGSEFSDVAPLLWARFQETAAGRFFEGAFDSQSEALLHKDFPEAAARIIVAADGILAGRFDLLGYHAVSFGDPVDWHLDPISGRRSRLVHWSLTDPLDASAVGDSKIVWEVNRHQWMVFLGEAYRLT